MCMKIKRNGKTITLSEAEIAKAAEIHKKINEPEEGDWIMNVDNGVIIFDRLERIDEDGEWSCVSHCFNPKDSRQGYSSKVTDPKLIAMLDTLSEKG